MRRLWLTLLMAAMGGLLLIPFGGMQTDTDTRMQSQREGGQTPAQEMKAKRRLLEQDVAISDQLCRAQCAAEMRKALMKGNGQTSNIQQLLSSIQARHPHMKQLVWTDKVHNGLQVKSGNLDNRVRTLTEPYVRKAELAIKHRKSYESPPIRSDGNHFIVLAVPHHDKKSAIIGIVEQHHLKHIRTEQKKNLRIAPYPSDRRWSVQSVDSDDLSDVNVTHPEHNEGTSHYLKREVIVKFKTEPTEAELVQIRADINALRSQKLGYTHLFESKDMSAKDLMRYFQDLHVEYVEPHFIYLTNANNVKQTGETNVKAFVPNDVLFAPYQWNLPMIKADIGWSIEQNGERVDVAVIDTGVDLSHPDLREHLSDKGTNFVSEGKPPSDDVGHGTHVTGVISALVNNVEGVAGISRNTNVIPIKVLDQTGAGSTYSVAQGVIYAADHGAKVINMSLGNYANASFLHDAVKYAFDKDVVLIAATGNDNTERPGYPAAYPEVFAVSATDNRNKRAPFSNFGNYVDVSAPGVTIASTFPASQYAALSGTSMASPHVAALAALIRSANPKLKNTEVMDIMRQSAQDLGARGKDKYYGYGLIDVAASLEMAKEGIHSNGKWNHWLERKLRQIERNFM